jgi:hypothetical protein
MQDEKIQKALKLIPEGGFIKKGEKPARELADEEKVVLIRKGNALFNQGNIELARKIFITTNYTDGIIRLGDYYYEHREPLEALKMYYLASYEKKFKVVIAKVAEIVKKLIKE